ncbi:MAG: hypothetical protein K2O03_10965 [Lachnospiraceae bacterium]|nr:hypothetical protein [Lachnospiraceae bacterium]
MGKTLSNEVKQALQDIYYNERTGRGKEAFALLEKASDAGDGDASCVLARCYCGRQYVWRGHGFPEDDNLATKLLHKSVEQGSALGVLVSLRTGELTPEVQKKMPFTSLQEAFDEAVELADTGDAFCQYIVANAYFWWDFLEIQNKNRNSFPNQAAYKAYLKENISKCEDLFWKAFQGGMYFAANNLNRYYTQGDEDIIAPQPQKALDLWKIGAEYGHPIHQAIYADDLKKLGLNADALQWYKLAAEGGHPSAWTDVGLYYLNGTYVQKDEAYAAQCFEKDLHFGILDAYHNLGRLLFYGTGVAQDYERAFQLFSYVSEHGSNKSIYFLGKCYFAGLGTTQDYTKARQFLEQVDWENSDAFYMLGYIYGRGLGVGEDIPKAVEYLKRAKNSENAKEELLHYKKSFFGKWSRR